MSDEKQYFTNECSECSKILFSPQEDNNYTDSMQEAVNDVIDITLQVRIWIIGHWLFSSKTLTSV